MREMERVQHELYARLPEFARKVDRALWVIEDAMREMDAPYLAYSGGSDSGVLLDMLFRAGYQLPVLFGDDGWDWPETLAFLRESEARYGFRLTRIRSLAPWHDWCMEMGRPDLADDPAAFEAWGNPHEWDDTWHTLTRDAPAHGYGGVFLGMLASESRARGYVLKGGKRSRYRVKSERDIWHCSPLAHFSKRDVWAYIVSRGIPYNPIYDRLAELGVPLEQRRVAPLTCYRVLQYGSGVQLRQIDGALWNKMSTLFPAMREYA